MENRFIQSKIHITLIASLLLFGCAHKIRGEKFERPDNLSIQLAKYDDVRSRVKAKPIERTYIERGKTIHSLTYGFEESTGGQSYYRTMVCYFEGGRLIGYDYLSSFEGEQLSFPGFGPDTVNKVEKGKSTFSFVITLMQVEPHGVFVYPLANNGGKIITYYDTSDKTYFKKLKVTFDSNDLVNKIEYDNQKRYK